MHEKHLDSDIEQHRNPTKAENIRQLVNHEALARSASIPTPCDQELFWK